DFVCWGPYDRLCFAQVYQDLTSWISSGTTTGVLKDMLTDECPGVNSDQTEITETATNIFPFQFKDFSYPGEIIPQLAAMSDFQNLTYDFWLRSLDPTPGAAPKKPQAYFKIRSTQVSPHYEARSSNFASGGVRITPDITRLVNSLRVLYTNSAGATAQTGGASDADSQSDFWLRELFKLTIGRATETAAEQYRDSYIGRFADVQQTISFEVNGWLQRLVKRTEDQFGGGREPLWKAVADFPVGFRWLGAPPERIPVSGSWGLDGRILFWTSALTYDYASNMLTIQPDTEPREFENIISRLQRMGGIA
nr:hypothetical protein [Anaerolineae bacterium]